MIRTAATLAVLLSGTALTIAQDLQTELDSFIGADGFERLDVDLLEKVLLDEFIDVGDIAPGGSVGPLEKALLIATAEIPSIRTRTAVDYGQILSEEDGPVSFIEVRHYNLGPAVRAETIAAYGEGDVADEDAFGLGDHMAWRFVFQPLMGNSAALIDVSSKVIPEKSAAKHDCATGPCLDPLSTLDTAAEWEGMDAALPEWPALYATEAEGAATPAHAVAQLAVAGFWANAEGGAYQWTGGEHPESVRDATPFRFIQIDRQLGQEASIDAIWLETALNDHALASITFRRAEIGGDVSLMRASAPR
ncbi:hypothetical protein [Devosia sediminis]|uniref:DUF4440 domain-containing protein n=1 Tax=Devosia sediminis TaxID=2798801 RepID=A0A934IML9_9HYPH|nr:hypothetical protein [Devosia sediminis]MBJ3783534.1 hypothetical protein [Devosia sediminis]